MSMLPPPFLSDGCPDPRHIPTLLSWFLIKVDWAQLGSSRSLSCNCGHTLAGAEVIRLLTWVGQPNWLTPVASS